MLNYRFLMIYVLRSCWIQCFWDLKLINSCIAVILFILNIALQETDEILENSQSPENIVQESLDSLEIDNSLQEKVIGQEDLGQENDASSIQVLQENHELEQETRHENVIENQTMQVFDTLNGNDLEENGLKESRDAEQAEELEKKTQREELALIPDESIYESLTSSEALAVILTFFIRNNILTKKEVEDSANQLIQILKDPLILNEYVGNYTKN